MITDIMPIFDGFIAEAFVTKPEIARFLITHERKKVCLERLCEQIRLCERRAFSITFDAQAYRKTIRDVAKMFCSQALEAHRQKNMTEAEKKQLRAENERDQYVDEYLQHAKKEGLIITPDEATVTTHRELPDNGAGQEEAKPKGILEH